MIILSKSHSRTAFASRFIALHMRPDISNYTTHTAFGTLLVYGSAALAGNSSTIGSLLLGLLLLFSVGILGLVNATTRSFHMFGRTIRVVEKSAPYARRLKMVEELLEEHPNRQWAINMRLITADQKLPTDGPSKSVMDLRDSVYKYLPQRTCTKVTRTRTTRLSHFSASFSLAGPGRDGSRRRTAPEISRQVWQVRRGKRHRCQSCPE